MAAWIEPERHAVKVTGIREYKGNEMVATFVYVNGYGEPVMRNGVPNVDSAAVRDYNVVIQMRNADGYSRPVVEIRRGRKRQNGPVEVVEVWRDGVRLA